MRAIVAEGIRDRTEDGKAKPDIRQSSPSDNDSLASSAERRKGERIAHARALTMEREWILSSAHAAFHREQHKMQHYRLPSSHS